MKTAAEAYPDLVDKDSFYGPGDYSPILEAFGEIVVRVDDDDYQGDSRVLYRAGERWGWLQFGWGSCSGCDSLQACGSLSDIQSLMDDLSRQVKWFDSATECLSFFRHHDWEGDYSWHRDEQKSFINQALQVLDDNANLLPPEFPADSLLNAEGRAVVADFWDEHGAPEKATFLRSL